LWNGYLVPGGLTLIAGKPKVGKSTVLFGLIEALTSGRPFLGRATQRAGVLLLSEEREGTLAEKQRKFGLDPDGEQVHLLMRHEARDHEWPEIVARASDYCRENGLGVLVVDTWDKWSGLGGDSENSAGAVIEALAPLLDAAASGLAVVIVTHHRKGGGKHGEAVRGSNALAGAVDVVIDTERLGDADEQARVLRAESRYSRTPAELVARLEDEGWTACGTTADVRGEAKKQAALQVLEESREPLNVADAAEKLDESASSVRRTLEELHAAGKITRHGQGKRSDPYLFSFHQPESLVVERNATPEEQERIDHLLAVSLDGDEEPR